MLVLKELHNRLHATVAEADGWSADLSDNGILARLVALNKGSAQEEQNTSSVGCALTTRSRVLAPRNRRPTPIGRRSPRCSARCSACGSSARRTPGGASACGERRQRSRSAADYGISARSSFSTRCASLPCCRCMARNSSRMRLWLLSIRWTIAVKQRHIVSQRGDFSDQALHCVPDIRQINGWFVAHRCLLGSSIDFMWPPSHSARPSASI
jgi:hypothetical protein